MSALTRIFETKREEVAHARSHIPLQELVARVHDAEPTQGFLTALKSAAHVPALIAEVKKASPSKGVIRENFDPGAVASAYRSAGADCLSVLTDVQYFQGSPENLKIAKRESGLPCLRKDFLFDPYQVYEARAWGADAILLIVAGLEKAVIHELQALAQDLGMDVLVEVHSESEAEIALDCRSELIGVNNRDLSNFRTDLSNSEILIPLLLRGPNPPLVVSESALESRADIDRVVAAGAKAVLIGTTFCAAPDIEAKVHEVMAW